MTATANTGYSSRSATVTISNGGQSQSRTISQAAGAPIPITVTITPVIGQFGSNVFAYQLSVVSSDASLTALEGVEVQFNFGGTTYSDSIEDINLPYTSPVRTVNGNGWGWNSASAYIEGVTPLGDPFDKTATMGHLGVMLSASETQISTAAQDIVFTVRSGGAWTLAFTGAWVDGSSATGNAGMSTVTRRASQNTGAARTLSAALTSGSDSDSVSISQAAAGIAFVITESTSDIGDYYGILSSDPTSSPVMSGTINNDGTTLSVYCENGDEFNTHTFYLGNLSNPVASVQVAPEDTGYMTLSYSDVETLSGDIEIRQSS